MRLACFSLAILALACSTVESRAPVHDAVVEPRALRSCSTQGSVAPERAVNFDVFVATPAELGSLFPGSLPPRAEPVSRTISEVRDPFEGKLIAGPFDPPLKVLSYEPDGPWPPPGKLPNWQVVSSQNIPWLRCGGLLGDGFEALGDALQLARPNPDDLQCAMGMTAERLITPMYLPPENTGFLEQFPGEFRDALASTKDTQALAAAWNIAFRTRTLEAESSAQVTGVPGRHEPPFSAERFGPYFSGLASDLVPLARLGETTHRNLYVYLSPD